MFSMHACFILLTLAVSLSAPQQQTETGCESKLVAISVWLEKQAEVVLGRDISVLETLGQLLTDTVSESHLAVALAEVSDRVIENFTSQLLLQCNNSQILIDLQVLKGRQAVAGAVQGARG